MTIRHRSFAVLAALIGAIFAFGGCVEPEDDKRTGWIDKPGFGELMSEPSVLEFGPVAVDSETSRSVELINVGTGRITITHFKLREDYESGPEFDGYREFFKGEEGWANEPVSLAPGESHRLTVRYVRQNIGADTGVIVLHTENTAEVTFEVPLEAPAAASELEAPEYVTFGRVPMRPHSPEWPGEHKLVEVRNIGQAVLYFDDIYLADSARFHLSFPQPGAAANPENDTDVWPERLAPGESFSVRVWFRPDDNLPERSELIFETNDADEPLYGVELLANAGIGPCLEVHPDDEINFGQVEVGETSRQTVTIGNCSRSQPLEISGARLDDDANGAISLEREQLAGDLSGSPAVLAPGERREIEVILEATRTQTYAGELVIASNDEAHSQLGLPIVARAGEQNCPRAVAGASLQGGNRVQTTIDTVPLNTVLFDGSNSSSPDGDLSRYEWTILSRPQGSTQRLLPDNSSVNPRLFLDVSGTYEVELTVYDEFGGVSCGERAIVTINAVPEDDVYIQLVWDTPGDPDQTDTFGTDLDLHYLHPDGHWNEPRWDIFWRSPVEDWGVQGDGSDDPHLDIDDTDGAGPESINHSGLENRAYQVGAYYYSDNTLGPSYATVRIYVRGALEFESERNLMQRSGVFWEVAQVSWPSGEVMPIEQMHQRFPSD